MLDAFLGISDGQAVVLEFDVGEGSVGEIDGQFGGKDSCVSLG